MAFTYIPIRYINVPSNGLQQMRIQKGINYVLQSQNGCGYAYIITYIFKPNLSIDAQIDIYYPNEEEERMDYLGTEMASTYLDRIKPSVAVQKLPERSVTIA